MLDDPQIEMSKHRTTEVELELNRRSISYDTLEVLSMRSAFSDMESETGEMAKLTRKISPSLLPNVAIIHNNAKDKHSTNFENGVVIFGEYVCVAQNLYEQWKSNGIGGPMEKAIIRCAMGRINPASASRH